MVPAVEIVVHEDLPVALEGPLAPLEEVESREVERPELRHEVAERLGERRAALLEADEHEFLPLGDLDRHEAARRFLEIADAAELGRALELARERVRPAVVRAAQEVRLSRRPRLDGRRVMAADVEERAQHAVLAAHDDQGSPASSAVTNWPAPAT